MNQKTQAAKQPRKSHRILVATVAVLLIAAAVTVAVAVVLREAPPAETEIPATASPVPETDPAMGDLADLGNGLVLSSLSSVAAQFPEDGSDELLLDLLCAEVRNDSAAMLQISHVSVTVNGIEYLFELTNLPAGATMRVYEKNRATAPAVMDSMEAECRFASFYETAPSPDMEGLSVAPAERGIAVGNLTDTSLEQTVYVYYKTVVDGVYVGGITYRVRVDGLAAGETVTVYAPHATAEHTEIMFVEYGNE